MNVRSILFNQRICSLGSSVTYGSASGGVSFVEMLAEATGCEAVKEAVSSTTLVDVGPESYVSRMRGMDRSLPVRLLVCQLSTNDAARGLPLGQPAGPKGTFTPDTVAGALETVIVEARNIWHCPAAFYTSPRYDSPSYGRMVELLLRIADLWDVPVIDLWNDRAFNDIAPLNRARWMADPIHPTLEGYREWWLPAMIRGIEDILKK
ncbi:MAG: SGNH/GDSL hydrolase family protein [Elusimicrobiales bacterium]|nr:SGNH/GDSL hydrolase family protein [Elusimicrobiales bacterium]